MAAPKPLHAIFFDIDDTLYSTTQFAARARRNAIEAMVEAGLEAEVDEVLQELRETIAEFSSNYNRHYDQLLKRMPPHTYAKVNRALLIAAGVVAYHRTKDELLRPYEDVLRGVQALAREDLTLGIITSGLEIKQAEKLVRLGLTPYLDRRAIFISEQIGIDKPNPKLYLRACREVGLAPAACMYVGDHPDKDVGPPKSLGMTTVLSRRDGKYSGQVGAVAPDYEIGRWDELVAIVRGDFRPCRSEA